MEASQDEFILPVPDIIEIYDKDRRKMDEYVASFPATQHGYRIQIANSNQRTSPVSYYECYRSGFPPGGASVVGKTKSAPGAYLYHSSSWLLIHSHLGHNHPPDPDVKPRKKYHDPNAKAILAPGIVLDNNTDPPPHLSHNPRQLTSNNIIPLAKPSIITPPPQPYYDLNADLKTLESIDSTVTKLRSQLCAMTPHRRQEVLIKIQTIISNKGIINNEETLPISFLPEPPEPTLLFDPLKRPKCYLTQEAFRMQIQLIKEFCGPSEVTTSTFKFEDLIISQSNQEAPLHTIQTASAPPAAVTLASLPLEAVTSTPLAGTVQPQTATPRVTQKQARKAALLQKPNLINPNLLALLVKYGLHSWLQPFVIDVREVKGDGHCGFQAIAISIGQNQDNWESIRQRMADTVTNMDDDQPLPESRTKALARLVTSKPNVVSERQYWLGMPSWGGVIASTFNRPVLYYGPGPYSQIVFPYSTPYNLNPPIVLAFAYLHFTSLLLDFTRPNFPAPRVCATWR
ncbi:hypothetical protein DFH28DRAFT_1130904 [Melampsora americana]|nr:hypothetical protein DFH28DRAFT_1130904 [Melampsora americana]